MIKQSFYLMLLIGLTSLGVNGAPTKSKETASNDKVSKNCTSPIAKTCCRQASIKNSKNYTYFCCGRPAEGISIAVHDACCSPSNLKKLNNPTKCD